MMHYIHRESKCSIVCIETSSSSRSSKSCEADISRKQRHVLFVSCASKGLSSNLQRVQTLLQPAFMPSKPPPISPSGFQAPRVVSCANCPPLRAKQANRYPHPPNISGISSFSLSFVPSHLVSSHPAMQRAPSSASSIPGICSSCMCKCFLDPRYTHLHSTTNNAQQFEKQ